MNLSAVSSVFSHIPIDWILIGVFVILIALDAMRGGLSRATALAIALPLTLLLLEFVQNAALLGSLSSVLSSPVLQLLFDAAALVVVFVLMYRLTDTFSSNSSNLVQSLLASIATVAIIITIWLQLPLLETLWQFGPQVQYVFGEAYRFWWLIASYIALAAARG